MKIKWIDELRDKETKLKKNLCYDVYRHTNVFYIEIHYWFLKNHFIWKFKSQFNVFGVF